MSRQQQALVERDDQPQALAGPQDQMAATVRALAENPNVDVDKLERIIELQRRMIADQAKVEFDTAFASMQADLPTVIETGKGHNEMSYAQLEDIVQSIRPILHQYGFSLSHRTEWPEKGLVKVIGILAHRAGHERTSEFVAPADSSGSKNQIQSFASTISYGRRYTTKDLLNIVSRGEDDDGIKAGRATAPVVPSGYDEWLTDLESTADNGIEALEAAWKASKPQYRRYRTAHQRAEHERLKQKAETRVSEPPL